MVYMYPLFKGTVLGLEVHCLKVLGLRLCDHAVVVPSGVQVVVNMSIDSVAVAFSSVALVDYGFPLMVLLPPKWDMVCLVFVLTLF